MCTQGGTPMAALLEQGDWKGTFRRQSECDIYIYIYLERERERETGREGEGRTESHCRVQHGICYRSNGRRNAWPGAGSR